MQRLFLEEKGTVQVCEMFVIIDDYGIGVVVTPAISYDDYATYIRFFISLLCSTVYIARSPGGNNLESDVSPSFSFALLLCSVFEY